MLPPGLAAPNPFGVCSDPPGCAMTGRMDETFDFRARPQDSGEEALPLPAGTLIYESLTTRFVSFDRLLETLSEAGHSGYIKLVAPGSNGIVLLKQGKLLESLYRAPEDLRRGESAIRAIEGAVHR